MVVLRTTLTRSFFNVTVLVLVLVLRQSSHRAHKDFSQDGFIEDNSNEVFLQCHSFSDDDHMDEESSIRMMRRGRE